MRSLCGYWKLLGQVDRTTVSTCHYVNCSATVTVHCTVLYQWQGGKDHMPPPPPLYTPCHYANCSYCVLYCTVSVAGGGGGGRGICPPPPRIGLPSLEGPRLISANQNKGAGLSPDPA